tara:strand:- start:4233 stop:4847 length:615 start_codon:yes stop_codon:yes gene_type:complete
MARKDKRDNKHSPKHGSRKQGSFKQGRRYVRHLSEFESQVKPVETFPDKKARAEALWNAASSAVWHEAFGKRLESGWIKKYDGTLVRIRTPVNRAWRIGEQKGNRWVRGKGARLVDSIVEKHGIDKANMKVNYENHIWPSTQQYYKNMNNWRQNELAWLKDFVATELARRQKKRHDKDDSKVLRLKESGEKMDLQDLQRGRKGG